MGGREVPTAPARFEAMRRAARRIVRPNAAREIVGRLPVLVTWPEIVRPVFESMKGAARKAR